MQNKLSKELSTLCELPNRYVYHLKHEEDGELCYINCFSKQQLINFLKSCQDKPKVHLVHINNVEFTEPRNFVNLLKLFKKCYTIYNNSFNGILSFEENFLEYLIMYMKRNKNFKKVIMLKDYIRNFQEWDYSDIRS